MSTWVALTADVGSGLCLLSSAVDGPVGWVCGGALEAVALYAGGTAAILDLTDMAVTRKVDGGRIAMDALMIPTSGLSRAVEWAATAAGDAASARAFGNAAGAFAGGPGDLWGFLEGVTGWNE